MTQFAILLVAASLAWPDPAEHAEQREFTKLATEIAASYDLRRTEELGKRLALRTEPVLKWSNPERGRVYGSVFIWTYEGRPEVIASIYKWYHPLTHSSLEFQSLSLGGVTGAREGAAAWAAAEPGVEPRPLPDAAPPAANAPERLRQMRALARQFRAEATSREGGQSQLRLLTQPIYRYEGSGGEWIDGALFAFVQATDPDVLLLVEALRDDGGATWQFALARLNSISLRAFHHDRQVWTAAELPWSEVQDRSRTYFSLRFQ